MTLTIAQATLLKATNVPEFMLDPVQNKMLAEALQKCTRHFPSVVSQKQQDFIALFGCMGAVTFAQSTAYRMRKARENKEKADRAESNVTQFPGGLN